MIVFTPAMVGKLVKAVPPGAHLLLVGDVGQLPSVVAGFFWFGCEDTEQTAGFVTGIVARRIPARFGLDSC